MAKEVGLWIDHREAVIVNVANEAITRISSDAEHSANSAEGSAEDKHERRVGENLHQYYTKVSAALANADSILIIGPGEAKGELKKMLESEKGTDRTVAVESADKLTEPQIVAKIRQHFAG